MRRGVILRERYGRGGAFDVEDAGVCATYTAKGIVGQVLAGMGCPLSQETYILKKR